MDNDTPDTSYALIMDDLLGEFSKTGKRGRMAINFATRFRHYVKRGDPCMICYSTQRYGDLDPTVRSNATGLLFSGHIKNHKDWDRIAEDFADTYGGREHFMSMVARVQAVPYAFLYLKLDTQPPEAFLNFSEQLYPSLQKEEKNNNVDEV